MGSAQFGGAGVGAEALNIPSESRQIGAGVKGKNLKFERRPMSSLTELNGWLQLLVELLVMRPGGIGRAP